MYSIIVGASSINASNADCTTDTAAALASSVNSKMTSYNPDTVDETTKCSISPTSVGYDSNNVVTVIGKMFKRRNNNSVYAENKCLDKDSVPSMINEEVAREGDPVDMF